MTLSLFSEETPYQPLAARMRPQQLSEYLGQDHLLAPGKPLYDAISQGAIHSMIFWGPPGVGKTTLAKLTAHHAHADFLTLSAVLSGVKEIRAAIDKALISRQQQRKTILFVDEVHRFNKAQQDAFLPYVEDGTLIFIGATTENPSFELNNALLSRARVYVLQALSDDSLSKLITNALTDKEHGLGQQQLHITDEAGNLLRQAADGDARRLLNLLEIAADLVAPQQTLTADIIKPVLSQSLRRFDKGGEAFYDQISALHKSVRGSDPDAALYWLARMLDGGCDPLYIARRVVRMASEDIGNADPRALEVSLNAWQVQERLGSPEGELAIAQAVVYCACAAKSNAVYKAFKAAMADVKQSPSHEVPLHLRNAPTQLMKSLAYGDSYRYAHDEPDAFAAGECYFPEEIKQRHYYQPVPRGLEQKINDKLKHLAMLNANSDHKRYQD
ncbi:replication-associated recombination protein A [Zooshikella ganghwensis]|uniref:Replication-associated recombination protein A n=1 Tax=Zooshikella ganghwensis TaxID=202772 RepID=A0A4P9VLH5_9GAMM|nr:replication-associated recombination protein A [Zooshikella ganghwensis]RDH44205.1 replication-associated recombination protein A [Zooshikella ganghwensis]